MGRGSGMTRGHVDFLKLVALLCMVFDHVGAYLLPDAQWLRIVGRLAFPLFAFALVQGFRHTSDFSRYSRRVLFLALAWQVPYSLFYALGYVPKSEPLNFVFILYLGLIILDMIRNENWLLSASIFSWVLFFDVTGISIPYGAYGLAFIAAIYFFDSDYVLLSSVLLALSLIPVYFGFYAWNQIFAPAFLVIVCFPLCISELPRSFYYFAYPLHLLVIFGVKYYVH